MNLNGFLDENARYKFNIATHIEIRKNSIIKIEDICAFCGLSNYKVKQYLNKINGNFQRISQSTTLHFIAESEIVAE